MLLPKRFKRRTFSKYVAALLFLFGVIIFLELSSSLIIDYVVSPTRMERFELFFLDKKPLDWLIPHPYLYYTHLEKIYETERYLNYIGKDRTDKIYIAALGGSTTETGYPEYTQAYLNRKLESVNSSLRAVVFNFGVGGWTSQMSLQNYVYVVRYLHPDFVVIHHNFNDWALGDYRFSPAVLQYPQISRWERALLNTSRFYRLLKFTYLYSYNQIRYGKRVIYNEELSLPQEARISTYLNDDSYDQSIKDFFTVDSTNSQQEYQKFPLEFILTETYESLIKYTRADNSTLIMTTQYQNHSRVLNLHEVLTVDEVGRRNQMYHYINNLLRNLSSQHNVPLLDLDKEMEPYDYLLEPNQELHFGSEGVRVQGELVGEYLFGMLAERYNLSG